jgi:hypothetical protein
MRNLLHAPLAGLPRAAISEFGTGHAARLDGSENPHFCGAISGT